jgi:hypothetical protein
MTADLFSDMPAPTSATQATALQLRRVARFPGLRVLAWSGNDLYASRGYDLLCANIPTSHAVDDRSWPLVGSYSPPLWRSLTASTRLTARLCRDGFHALAVLPSAIIAALPGTIVKLAPNEPRFHLTHRITRGTRPLHITAVPNGPVLWGEYFDNASRDEVHIFASADSGDHWDVAYTFPRGAIRHIHNIVYDPWANCLWILTGDYGNECRILRASCDLSQVDVVLQGNQQARAVALLPTEDGLYFSSDTPLEPNFIFRLDRSGILSRLAPISGSSIYGCQVRGHFFFSTMVEPSAVNTDPALHIYGSRDRKNWSPVLSWKKDRWPMAMFQYGNAFLPDGNNTTNLLAVTTVAVENDDLVSSLYSIS